MTRNYLLADQGILRKSIGLMLRDPTAMKVVPKVHAVQEGTSSASWIYCNGTQNDDVYIRERSPNFSL